MAIAYKGDNKNKKPQPAQLKKAQAAKKETVAVIKEKEAGKVEKIDKPVGNIKKTTKKTTKK